MIRELLLLGEVRLIFEISVTIASILRLVFLIQRLYYRR